MTTKRTLLAFALSLGAVFGGVTAGYGVEEELAEPAGKQQCYYRPGIDPDNSCTRCSETCLGTGYRCCTIIADAA